MSSQVTVGRNVFSKLGLAEGLFVDFLLLNLDGLRLGDDDGARDGSRDGLFVGKSVGTTLKQLLQVYKH